MEPKKLIRVSLFTLFSAIISACGDSSSSDGSSTVAISTQDQLQGVWEKRGYGTVLEISENTVTTFDFSSHTCVRADSGSLGELVAQLDEETSDGEEFSLRTAALGFAERYYRVDSLPAVCNSPIGSRPTEVYSHIWHTFNEYYGFFVERGVDWNAQNAALDQLIDDDMSEVDLFDALRSLIEPIDDAHVSIHLPDGTGYSPAQPKGFVQELITEFEAQSEIATAEQYVNQAVDQALDIIDNTYLNGKYAVAGGPTNDFFKWGVMPANVGYLSIGAFILQFDQTISDQLVQVEDVIDQALNDLSDTQALVIDVRLSPGGADPIAIAIANRFTDKERLAITKELRPVNGSVPVQQTFVRPSDRVQYVKPVLLLTSGFSASATEAFVLAMRALPQVTHLGEPTNGALSDLLERKLPNGWVFTLSNEVYRDANGHAFEALGIPPDITVPVFRKEARVSGQDSALNAAFEALSLPSPAQ